MIIKIKSNSVWSGLNSDRLGLSNDGLISGLIFLENDTEKTYIYLDNGSSQKWVEVGGGQESADNVLNLLRDGVVTDGDTLKKLYDLITTNNTNINQSLVDGLATKEDSLGNPTQDDMVLFSKADGTREWKASATNFYIPIYFQGTTADAIVLTENTANLTSIKKTSNISDVKVFIGSNEQTLPKTILSGTTLTIKATHVDNKKQGVVNLIFENI